MVDIPPEEVSSTANEKDFALPVGDLRGDVGGVDFEAMNIFRGLDSALSRATASVLDAMPLCCHTRSPLVRYLRI